MKVCPVCQASYGDEFLYCKSDGTALVPEQPSAPKQPDASKDDFPVVASKKNVPVVPLAIACVAVLGAIVWFSLPKRTPNAASASGSSVNPDVPEQTSQAPVSPAAPPAVDELSAAVSSVKEIYARSDAAYSRLDAQGHMAYVANDWTFKDLDGTRETKADSLRYFEKRFSKTDPKRVISCRIETKLQDEPTPRLEDGVLVARVAIDAHSEDLSGKKRSVSISQEDRWRKAGGAWECFQSKVLSRN